LDSAPILMVGSESTMGSLFAASRPFADRTIHRVHSFAEAEVRLDARAYAVVICHSDTYEDGGAQFVTRVQHRQPEVPCVFVDSASDATTLHPLLPPASGKQMPHVVEKLRTIVHNVDNRDPQNKDHSPRVAQVSVLLGEAVGLCRSAMAALETAALLHDVGKMGVPSAVLSKPSALDKEEWELMRRHPGLGSEMLRRLGLSDDILAIVRHHHERCDGRGYPDGLKHEEIPFGARIVALADAYVAMTARRSYRPALPQEEAHRRIEAGLGSQFDAELGDAFLRLNSSV
jgi:putative nucleotidyltransferase with HDIG domain